MGFWYDVAMSTKRRIVWLVLVLAVGAPGSMASCKKDDKNKAEQSATSKDSKDSKDSQDSQAPAAAADVDEARGASGAAKSKDITRSLEGASNAVVAALTQGAIEPATAAVHRSRDIFIEITTEEGRKTVLTRGVHGFTEEVTKIANGDPVEMKAGKCEDSCCLFESKFSDERSQGTQVKKVCFDKDKDGVLTLAKVELSVEQ